MDLTPGYDSIAELRLDFHARGLFFSEHKGDLAVRPKTLLTEQDRAEIALWKSDILCELQAEKRPSLDHLFARVLETYPAVLHAQVERGIDDEWNVQVDLDKEHDLAEETSDVIREVLYGAARKCADESTRRDIRIYETLWFGYNHGEPPYYFMYVSNLGMPSVAVEAVRLAREERAKMESFREMVLRS